ncbi:hypothetical protein [Pediococcus acidilactici]|uniref:hypothetical protein n=1 Tax=Pediococcus acidilactici TaxID=1254 RepID=UPI00194F1068|nr:hypothetical protein [Pediococcus acidilactici]MBM6602854.1 hypothetical protein [Pediococcus acidilactici]
MLKSEKELTVMLLSALYAHNAELAVKVGNTEKSASNPISAKQAAEDYKVVYKALTES